VKYEVTVTAEAQARIRDAFLYIHERSPLNGAANVSSLAETSASSFISLIAASSRRIAPENE
jgi:hypothetical protein